MDLLEDLLDYGFKVNDVYILNKSVQYYVFCCCIFCNSEYMEFMYIFSSSN